MHGKSRIRVRKNGFLHESVFEVIEGFLLSVTPFSGGVFTYEVNEEACCLGEIFNEAVIIIGEAKEFSNTFNIDRDVPGFDYVNLFLGHVDTLI